MGYSGKHGIITLEKKDSSDEEPMFVLRGQDILAPYLVDLYADLYESATNDSETANKIRDHAQEMRNWQPRKLPDTTKTGF